MIYGHLKGYDEPVPLTLLGDGVRRVASMVLAMGYARDGTLLVDEIENGIHHSVLGRLWEAIGYAAQLFNTQVVATTHSLECIGNAHPEARDDCIAALSRVLAGFAGLDPTLNAFLISYLVELKAVETAPLMEQAFAADAVDESVHGDWEDVQVDLGLLQERQTPRPNYLLESLRPAGHKPPPPRKKDSRSKRKAKRKQQKSSRRKQRKRKK